MKELENELNKITEIHMSKFPEFEKIDGFGEFFSRIKYTSDNIKYLKNDLINYVKSNVDVSSLNKNDIYKIKSMIKTCEKKFNYGV
jgi:hypothetical protein|tara:strand:+ start:3204 stop:3461 length:258 start_codon:yes stop_codon:yes gene_type:complete